VDPSALDEGFPGESQAEARRVNAFLGGLTVSFTATASNVLDIRYRAADPVLAARFANTHAQEYINQNVDRRFAAIQEVTDWLADRLAEQRQKVDASEQALARFREENGLTTIEGSSPTVTRLNELTASLTRTQAERLEKEALYNKAQALRGDPDSLDRLPLMASDKALQERRLELDRLERHRTELAATLRERHPEMVKVRQDLQTARAMLDAERTRLLESLRQEVATLQGAEASLGRALDGLELEAVTQDRKGVQLSVLMREAESNRQIYDLLLQRARETGVAKDLNPSRTRVLDRALVPAAPVSPNRQRNILRGLFAGLALALMVAFGLERVDSRVKTPDEVSEHLGLPYIGLLPEVALEGGATRPLATNGIAPQFSEELRRIRTNVLFSFSGDAARSVVVTSASPGEGKTVLASNLAVALAQAKERVLLVDADLRRPALHEAFPVPQEPGLSNVLVGECKLTQAVHESAVRNLWILPAGRRPPNPSELLGSAEFRRLLAYLNERFTWILFDTPPVMAVTDACVLAHSVSGVVFVVGSEQVSRHLARRAVGQIAAAHGKLVGGVLNRVAVHRNKYYYSSYSAAYSKKYGGYYHQPPPAEAETESTPGRAHA
jgi:capsular exopolysaccharide synthesis family protein